MFAVIKAGGKQYRVAAEDVIRIDRVEKKPGEVVAFGARFRLRLGLALGAGRCLVGRLLAVGEDFSDADHRKLVTVATLAA
jgi:large subunit ribosomal protein L21